jgi:hypothetical protein
MNFGNHILYLSKLNKFLLKNKAGFSINFHESIANGNVNPIDKKIIVDKLIFIGNE